MNGKILVEELGNIKLKDSDKRARRRVIVECPVCSLQRVITEANYNVASTTKCTKCKKITHGKTGIRLYAIWRSMKQRCNNPKNAKYEDYGARGITVCEDWQKFEPFEKWSLENGSAKGLTIDRRDNDKGYSPSNCRWVTMAVQADNKRLLQKNNTSNYRCVTFDARIGRWVARTTHDKKTVFIGHFTTSHQAAKAYNEYVIANKLNKKLNILNIKG